MRGNKTTATEPVQAINKILKKHGITNTSYGIIIPVKNRQDHRVTIKYVNETGAHKLVVTGKYGKQEFRIYDDISEDYLREILISNLGEQYRIL
tara:strand:+ start:1908 stop:2189 length:282 start_codon:yes stop_codon:yes gene_type:complete